LALTAITGAAAYYLIKENKLEEEIPAIAEYCDEE